VLPASQLGLGSRAGLVRPPLHGLPVLRNESVTTPGSARSWTLSGGLRARPAAHPNPTFSAQRTTHTTAPCPVLGGRALGLTHELHFVSFARAARARRKSRIGESAGAAPRGRPRAAQTRLLSGRAPAQRRVAGRGRRRRGGGGGRCMWPRGVLRIQNPELSG